MTTVNLNLRITTCVKPDALILNYLEKITNDIKQYENVVYRVIERKKLSISSLFDIDESPLLVIQHDGIVLYTAADNKIFYHENTTRVKYKSLINQGNIPPLIEMFDKDSEVKIVIDATMGMANDLILMALSLPGCKFYAFEENFYIHFAIKWGIIFYYAEINKDFLDTDRIHFVYGNVVNRIDILQKAQVIYVDPMYEETVKQSNIASLVKFVDHHLPNDYKLLNFICSNFSGKVILRAHFRSGLINDFGFKMNVRKQSKTHYGYKIVKNNKKASE